jgi:hypothetical protein
MVPTFYLNSRARGEKSCPATWVVEGKKQFRLFWSFYDVLRLSWSKNSSRISDYKIVPDIVKSKYDIFEYRELTQFLGLLFALPLLPQGFAPLGALTGQIRRP